MGGLEERFSRLEGEKVLEDVATKLGLRQPTKAQATGWVADPVRVKREARLDGGPIRRSEVLM